MAGSAEELGSLLVLEQLDVDLFRGIQPTSGRQRVFGGQVAAQSVMAATSSVKDVFVMHSLHSYFLRPGDTKVPIIYDVEAMRDGRSFVTRRVAARQHGRPIFFLTAKTPGRQLALDALVQLRRGQPGLPLRALELVARDKACEYPDKACHGDSCPLARGFYDRLPAARTAALNQPLLDRESVRAVALAHQVCPYSKATRGNVDVTLTAKV